MLRKLEGRRVCVGSRRRSIVVEADASSNVILRRNESVAGELCHARAGELYKHLGKGRALEAVCLQRR